MNWPTPYRRGTILVPSGPVHDPDKKHLFVVLTDPCPTAGDVLMVNVSTIRHGHDPACKLFAGDHPFIRRDSFVEYVRARIEAAGKLRMASEPASWRLMPTWTAPSLPASAMA